LGKLEEGPSTRDFDSWMKGLPQEAAWRGPWGGLLYWGTQKMKFLRAMQNAL